MKPINFNQYLIRFKSGEFWRFTSENDKGILLYKMAQNNVWSKPVLVVSGIHQEFSVCIDGQDKLHLICQTKQGELLYMTYSEKNWSKQILAQYEPLRHVVRHPAIIPIRNCIHILFCVGTSFNIGLWSLYDFFWDGTSWKTNQVCKFTGGRNPYPIQTEVSNMNLHLVFRGLYTDNHYQIFHCRYHHDSCIWSTPEVISHNTRNCTSPSILLDEHKIHLSWLSMEENGPQVKYINASSSPYQSNTHSQGILLSAPGSNCSNSQLMWVEQQMWCLWYQQDSLFSAVSSDGGTSWSESRQLEWNSDLQDEALYYSSNYSADKTSFRSSKVICQLAEGIKTPIHPIFFDGAFPTSAEQNQDPAAQTQDLSEAKPEGANPSASVLSTEPPDPIQAKLDELYMQNKKSMEEIDRMSALVSDVMVQLQSVNMQLEDMKNEVRRLHQKGVWRRIFGSSGS